MQGCHTTPMICMGRILQYIYILYGSVGTCNSCILPRCAAASIRMVLKDYPGQNLSGDLCCITVALIGLSVLPPHFLPCLF